MGQQGEDNDASTQYCVCQQTDSGASASGSAMHVRD